MPSSTSSPTSGLMIVSLVKHWSSRFRVASPPGPAPVDPTFPRRSAPPPRSRWPLPAQVPTPAAPPPTLQWRRGGEPERQRAGAGAEPGSGQQQGPSEAGPVGPRWAWRSRPSPPETECFKMARNSIHPETETSLSSSELANRKSSRVLKRGQPSLVIKCWI
ncbi:peptidyl-prolyl cis-trans isomerase FKBP1B isoform X2 [Odocoileus virginianus]|uniref:Peptidyl-prolyl cis-trans isomerase FKBP1B isoform X2 n=1 Tax=Odocoileus virginianus TaxID=9874 RepID=A0ABM4GV34_ODOVR